MISKHCGKRLQWRWRTKVAHTWRCVVCKRYFTQRVRVAKEKAT